MANGFRKMIISNLGLKPIDPIQCGLQSCPPEHTFGPAIRDFWLLHFVMSGKGRLINNQGEFEVSENELFVIAPYQTAKYIADKNDPWSYIWIGFKSDMPLPEILSESSVIKAPHLRKCFHDAFHDDFFTENRSDGSYEHFLCGMIFQIIGKLINTNNKKPSAYDSYVRPAIGIMETEYHSQLTVEEIAKRLHVSKGYFFNVFKAETGKTPQKYLEKVRMSKSTVLLTMRRLNVTLTAASVGYPDVFAFSRAFKRHFGVSPTEYAEKHITEQIVKKQDK